MNSLQRDVGFA